MAPRSSWKGFIKLSLVSVPVKAFTANDTSAEVRLNQLHKESHSRIRYKKVTPEHDDVKGDDIVSGYEYAKDQYVVIDPDELAKIRTQSDRSIALEGFVGASEIDPLFFAGKNYILLPDGVAGNRPYALLRQGMVESEVVGIAQIVISGREQLVMLRPVDKLIVMSVLNYHLKVKSLNLFTDEYEEPETTDEERKLTQTLIDATAMKEFDYAQYMDKYVENLKKLIEMKVAGQEIVQAPTEEEPKIINLMDALKKSVAEAQASSKKMAPSVKSAGKKAAKKKSSKKKTG